MPEVFINSMVHGMESQQGWRQIQVVRTENWGGGRRRRRGGGGGGGREGGRERGREGEREERETDKQTMADSLPFVP
jgi:hypothetical protein